MTHRVPGARDLTGTGVTFAIVGTMSHVARYGRLVAVEGRGRDLAALLLKAADGLADHPGCELYLVNRQADDVDTLWVTELWRSQADLDASIEQIRGSEDLAAAMALVKASEMIELDLLGGKGPTTVQR